MPVKLRTRLLLSLVIVFALSGVCEFLIGHWLIYPRFLELERADTVEKLQQATRLLEHELDQLLPSVSDWAVWDDSYAFARDGNQAFIAANLGPGVLPGLTINLLAFHDRVGKRIWVGASGLDEDREQAVAVLAPERLSDLDLALQEKTLDRPLGRFVWTRQGLFLVGIRSILTTAGEGPPMGALVMARLLDQAALARLGALIGVDLRLDAPDPDSGLPLEAIAPGRSSLGAVSVRELPDALAGRATLFDADGRPMIGLTVLNPKSITARGREAMWLAGLSLALAGVLALALVMALLQRMVIAPLALLTEHATRLGTDHELSARLDLHRSDEIGVLADALDRMTASLGLAHQRLLNRLSAHMDNSPLAVIEVDSHWRILRWSGEAEQLFGWPAEEVLGRAFNEVGECFPDHQVAMEMPSAEKLLGNPIHWRHTQRHVHRNGMPVDCIWYTSALFDQTDQLTSLLILLEDITERRRAEGIVASHQEQLEQEVAERTRELELSMAALAEARDQAEAGNRAKSAFLATMSHEIRTPMNAVLGLTELLKSTSLDVQQQHFVDVIHQSGESLLDVINDILDFSKIEAGKLILESQAFDPRKLFDELVELFSEAASAKGLRISARLSREFPRMLRGDRVRLRQILVNLIGNAVKFTAQGQIQVSASATLRADERILLGVEVQDTGAGIPPDVLPTIFNAFAQGDDSTTREHGGTGLGLAICQQLAHLMNGSIRVESKPGQGTRFMLEIPVERVDDSPLQDPPAAAAAAPERLTGRVLLAEDDLVNRELAILMLKSFGLEVITAGNGEDAVRLVEEQDDLSLVLMDCHMPGMNGLRAASAIRERERSAGTGARGLPIIALTADVEAGLGAQCADAGMDAYLSKPFSQQQLLEAIRPWLAAGEA